MCGRSKIANSKVKCSEFKLARALMPSPRPIQPSFPILLSLLFNKNIVMGDSACKMKFA